MSLKNIALDNFTAFEHLKMDFCGGINVLIGGNGTGKTHIMKVLYAACQAAALRDKGIDFFDKLKGVFWPSQFNGTRLIHGDKNCDNAFAQVESARWTSKTFLPNAHDDFTVSFINRSHFVNHPNSDKNEAMNLISTFIPAKEILSNARNLHNAVAVGNVDFDDCYTDLISAASVNISRPDEISHKEKYLKKLQGYIHGKVAIENEEFFLIPEDESSAERLEFNLMAEGERKLALLWQLIKNGRLEKGSVLFWDEPEANINPGSIPFIVDLLLDLQEDGVQIFIATHDYFLSKYLDIKERGNTRLKFFSLYRDENRVIRHETADAFTSLEHNLIIEEQARMYVEEVNRVLD